VALLHEQSTLTERPLLVSEVSANFWRQRVLHGQHNGSPRPYSRFLDRIRYYFFITAPQLYSRGWVGPFPDPLLLRKSGSAGNQTWDLWICSQELWPLDHRGSLYIKSYIWSQKAKSFRHHTKCSFSHCPNGKTTCAIKLQPKYSKLPWKHVAIICYIPQVTSAAMCSTWQFSQKHETNSSWEEISPLKTGLCADNT
jgi:hypothetical protein